MMMRQLEHPNVLDLRYFFYTHGYGYKVNAPFVVDFSVDEGWLGMI